MHSNTLKQTFVIVAYLFTIVISLWDILIEFAMRYDKPLDFQFI